jgi:hypothetical protein
MALFYPNGISGMLLSWPYFTQTVFQEWYFHGLILPKRYFKDDTSMALFYPNGISGMVLSWPYFTQRHFGIFFFHDAILYVPGPLWQGPGLGADGPQRAQLWSSPTGLLGPGGPIGPHGL